MRADCLHAGAERQGVLEALAGRACVVVVPVKGRTGQPSCQSVTLVRPWPRGRAVVLSILAGLWAPDELRGRLKRHARAAGSSAELAHPLNLLLDDRARATALGEAVASKRPLDATTRGPRTGAAKCVD